jgi:hypothetical protein
MIVMTVEFSPTHHALLFAWIAQETLQRAGAEPGQAVLRRAVRQYGEQRGRRMAQRAQSAGRPLDMTSYLAYGEWQAAAEMFDTRLESAPQGARSLVFRCPWHQAWFENGLNDSGRLYCLEIDEALGRGFNPELRLEVQATRSNMAEACRFIYHGANLEALQEIQVDRSRTVMPWDYHLGHLYQTMFAVLQADLGPAGEQAAQAGLAAFARRFGEQAAERIRAFQDANFDHTSEWNEG